MKITKVDILRLPRAGGSVVFCRVHTDAGIYGDGEVAGICAYSVTVAMLREFASRIIGMDPLKNELIWNTLYKRTFFGQNGGPITFAGISGIDIALWDIKGKYYGVPIHELLGGKCRDRLRSYASQIMLGWFETGSRSNWDPQFTVDDYKRVTELALAEGYDAVKADLFTFEESREKGKVPRPEKDNMVSRPHLEMIERRMEAIRNAAGPSTDIIVECHAETDMLGSLQVYQAIGKYGVMYYEEPNTPTPYTAEIIARRLDAPLAAGERIYSRWQYVPYFENRSLGIIQPDIGNCGGFTETKKICDMGYAYDVGVQIHTCGSPLSTSIAMQLEAVIPNFVIHEHHGCVRFEDQQGITKYNPEPVNGYLEVPDEPGLGNELTPLAFEKALELYTVQ